MKQSKTIHILCLILCTMVFSLTTKAQTFVNWTSLGGTPNTWSGTYTGGTVSVTQGATGSNIGTNPVNLTNLNGASGTQGFGTSGPNFAPPSKSLIFTFSTPVIINELSIADIDLGASWNDSFTFSGVTFTSVTGALCTFTTTSATATTDIAASAEWARWTTSTTPVSSFTINFATIASRTHAVLNYAMKITAACNTGTTAPTLSATTKANVCPATTVDLTTITASNLPSGTSLTWHTATPATTANKIATPSAVAAGTYYAAFFDATNNCYSGTGGDGSATTSVTATVNSCGSATSCTLSGVTMTTTGTSSSGYFAPTPITNNGCTTTPYTGLGAYTGTGNTGTVTYTFSSPVSSATVKYSVVNGGGIADVGAISVNGGGTATLSNPCGVSVAGLTITGLSSGYGDPSITVTSTLPFTTITVTNVGGQSGWVQGNPCDITFTLASTCNAGTTAPTLSATTKANVCPATTVDLTTITASNLPASTTLTWHTATPATTANKIATPSAVAAGTYYAAFFDATNNCYSGTGGNGSATTVVTATTTTCAALTANNPTTQTVPGGQVYTGNAGTELAPTGGTGPYTYSNGSSDPACINPGGGAIALPPASNLTVTNSTTGAYTYTAPTVAGTYFFCIKACDSTSPTPSCVVKTYTVVVPCAAGSNPPVLIKN